MDMLAQAEVEAGSTRYCADLPVGAGSDPSR